MNVNKKYFLDKFYDWEVFLIEEIFGDKFVFVWRDYYKLLKYVVYDI